MKRKDSDGGGGIERKEEGQSWSRNDREERGGTVMEEGQRGKWGGGIEGEEEEQEGGRGTKGEE